MIYTLLFVLAILGIYLWNKRHGQHDDDRDGTGLSEVDVGSKWELGSEWYMSRGGIQYGPMSSRDVAKFMETGRILGRDYLWKKGMTDWQRASEVQGLFPEPEPSITPPSYSKIPFSSIDDSVNLSDLPTDSSFIETSRVGQGRENLNSEEKTALRQLLALRVDPASFEEKFGSENVRLEVSSFTYLLEEVQEACAVMQRNRPSLPYRAIEKGAALLMFGLWRREGGADASDPALAAANVVFAVIENMFVDPEYVSLIRRQVPDFDPIEEVSWAKTGVKHDRRDLCFTRAVTMITHQLADRFASGRAAERASAISADDVVDWGTALLMATAPQRGIGYSQRCH